MDPRHESGVEYRVRPVDGALDVPTGCVGARRPTPQERLRLGALAKHEERDLHAVVTISFKVQSLRIR